MDLVHGVDRFSYFRRVGMKNDNDKGRSLMAQNLCVAWVEGNHIYSSP